jgi:hypothetical protein
MAGKPNKTLATDIPVETFLARVASDERRADAQALVGMMGRLSGEPARIWGPTMVGFGVRRYRYDSGREGEIFKIGFSPRASALVLYVVASTENDPLLARLGKFTTGQSCVYVKRLADIDLAVLEAVIQRALSAA